MNYIVYNESGSILRTGKCKPSDLQLQAKDGEYVIEGNADSKTQIIINGQVQDKPQSELDSIRLEELSTGLRAKRNALLDKTDWTQMPDSPLSEQDKLRYKKYRQALRDLPQNYGTINELSDVTFPNIEDF